MVEIVDSGSEYIPENPILKKLLEDARRRLLETGTRNRLIHVNRANKRANVLNIINERSDDIFKILRSKGRKMRFLAKGKDANDDDGELLFSDLDDEFDEARYTDNNLETPLGPDALQKRLLRLSRDSRTAEEEQGVNILYLALGFLTWFEDDNSKIKREAPLILLPVSLERNMRTASYDIICRDDDIVTNLPLQERLKNDFGIELPEIDETEDDFNPSEYFQKIYPLVSERKEWGLDENGMQLGFFSFAKLLMMRDLDPENWPNKGLLLSSLISGLLEAKYETSSPMFGPNDKLDELFEPKDIIQVVEADASQTKVIEEVRNGRDLVVQGPPGTGKSQTITNIIASAVHDGKKVLFVAEKMAALSVVYKRMVGVGLQNVCLELHSRNANKKKVLYELSRTLNEASATANMPQDPEKLKKVRDLLNQHAAILHQRIPETEFTPFEAISKLVHHIGQEHKPPPFKEGNLALLTREQIARLDTNIATASSVLKDYSRPSEHPFYGTQQLDLQPPDVQRLEGELTEAKGKSAQLINLLENLKSLLNIPSVSNLKETEKLGKTLEIIGKIDNQNSNVIPLLTDEISSVRLGEALEAGHQWQSYKSSLENKFTSQGIEYSVSHLRPAIMRGKGSFFARFGSAYRNSSRELAGLLKSPIPKKADERLALVDELLELERKKRKLSDDEGYLKDILKSEWRGESTPFEAIKTLHSKLKSMIDLGVLPSAKSIQALIVDKDQLAELRNKLAGFTKLYLSAFSSVSNRLDLNLSELFNTTSANETDLSKALDLLNTLSENSSSYDSWVRLAKAKDILTTSGLGKLVENLENTPKNSEEISQEFHYALSEALWAKARAEIPALDELIGTSRNELVNLFQTLEKDRIKDVQKLIYKMHLEQLPLGSVGEMGTVRGEIAKRTRHKPIRKLMTLAGTAIQKIKPVFLMSPISVAQFLPPEKLEFDLLVIDEASQVRPEDALGAIARCKQIVVVGDQQQLPPTNFFSRLTGNAEDDEDDENEDPLGGTAKATEMESILTLCEARGLNQRRLEWHYRSRDPSLIKVSNAEFYENGLVLPPSPLQEDENYGFKFTKVNGIYARGKTQKNKIEAQAVVNALKQHARKWPDLSAGIVTFSTRQRDEVTEQLEHARRDDKVLDNFLREGRNEDVFVKNIENVQGDERDVILISVGYGPEEAGGRLRSMNFGPINKDGGERRLNVLFSRSRIRCEVFASFEAGDIDLNRTSKEGPRVLKRFLEYAKTGYLEEHSATGHDYDSLFEEDVAKVIRSLGYELDAQVGSGGFVIDLGIKHPQHAGQYMLAVECDGATYHSALWARERDRSRQGILEGLGWKFHRIWSTDWFQRRDEEIKRLSLVLKEAAMASSAASNLKGANEGCMFVSDETEENKAEKIEIQPLELPELKVPNYVMFDERVSSYQEPHEIPNSTLGPVLKRMIMTEGPIHEDEVARRLATCFGKKKAGSRIMSKTKRVLNQIGYDADFRGIDGFWGTVEQFRSPPVRNRSKASGGVIKANYIPPMEIRQAAKLIVEQSGEVERDELVKAIGKLFGFKRVGPDLNNAFNDALGDNF